MAESLVYIDENGNSLGHIVVSGPVTVLQTPISERYCRVGDTANLDIKSKQIRCGGAWFNFNDRWQVKPLTGA
jgi:hypothetical protein